MSRCTILRLGEYTTQAYDEAAYRQGFDDGVGYGHRTASWMTSELVAELERRYPYPIHVTASSGWDFCPHCSGRWAVDHWADDECVEECMSCGATWNYSVDVP